ncbi:hypothetical protein T310_6741 [Rasamsonia emersonii CBS 393.64]|uniref:Xylanolytic transcriptional activator regulatory domain-containing protein n=1 Tax=Rasamsonia emersonii (strain ATCC 16479 / CBS 393.64 / IMI 116815) TaxID=1408163 RepID=A0A0F4YM27_RASE3|nr:hypothetical protein T310_6741 [Rasamsonia emersonii CBS 393.64]KKA19284.1 hypothetical protein T310_6741 [Rasamsonia emersonii CBS 393.64]
MSRRPTRAVNLASSRTRTLSRSRKEDTVKCEQDDLALSGFSTVAGEEGFRVLGYLPNSQDLQGEYASIEGSNVLNGVFSVEMESVLLAIPPKPYTDRASGRKLRPEFTCLLLRVCACSTQYLGAETRQKLELQLGESIQTLTERYHHAAQQLSNNIRPGKGGLTQVQQLLLAASWLKSEAMFTESWHTLCSAIHEAQELGMHKDSSTQGISEFDREMRRRIWCILYTWDWQMSMLLSRPLIINHSCCSFELPNLRLESTPDTDPDLPSPITHMALQCQLAQMLSKIPGVTGGILPADQAVTIQQEIEKWFSSFPPAYRVTDPDTQWDEEHRYVILQRGQLHAVGYMIMLHPLKPFLTRSVDSGLSDMERSLRPAAVDCSLKLMQASRQLFDCVFPINAKFHFVIFIIFDTAAVLCSAITHDTSCSLPRRHEVIEAIGLLLNMMERLSHMTKTGAICYATLATLVAKLSLSSQEKALLDSVSPESLNSSTGPLGTHQTSAGFDPGNISSTHTMPSTPTSQGLHIPETETSHTSGINDISCMDVGELGQIWDWETLDLNLSFPPAP